MPEHTPCLHQDSQPRRGYVYDGRALSILSNKSSHLGDHVRATLESHTAGPHDLICEQLLLLPSFQAVQNSREDPVWQHVRDWDAPVY
jgi:hypothetical protein